MTRNKKHRKYDYPIGSNSRHDGTSDSYKSGHSISYEYCTCAIGKDHEAITEKKPLEEIIEILMRIEYLLVSVVQSLNK